jgi:membrane protein implicated in regulation of membrane protease activity
VSLEKSYWTTTVNIDPQFGVANLVPWCFAPFSEKPACNLAIEDAAFVDNPPYTNMGRYPIFPFMVSGAGTIFGANDISVLASRLTLGAMAVALLGFAFSSVAHRKGSVPALLMAITPGVIFLSAVMNPSALEIASAITLWTIFPHVFESSPLTKIEVGGVAVAGVVLIATRPLGPAMYLVALLFSCAVAGGWARLGDVWRRLRSVWMLHLSVIALAIGWYAAVFSKNTGSLVTEGSASLGLRQQIIEAVQHIPVVLEQGIGNFGWLDTPMPRMALMLYSLMFFSLLVFSVVRSTPLVSSMIVSLSLVSALLVVAQDISYYNLLRNFGSQGRHVMPLLVGIPILAMRKVRLPSRANAVVAVVWAIIMVWSGLAALRRYAVGIRPGNQLEMYTQAVWQPDIGIWLATFALAFGAITSARCAWRINVTAHDR